MSFDAVFFRTFLLEVGVDPKSDLVDLLLSMSRKLHLQLPISSSSLRWLNLRPAILTEIACRERGIDVDRENLMKGVQKASQSTNADKSCQDISKKKRYDNKSEYCRLLAMCRTALRMHTTTAKVSELLGFYYDSDLIQLSKDIWSKSRSIFLNTVNLDQPVYICASLKIAAENAGKEKSLDIDRLIELSETTGEIFHSAVEFLKSKLSNSLVHVTLDAKSSSEADYSSSSLSAKSNYSYREKNPISRSNMLLNRIHNGSGSLRHCLELEEGIEKESPTSEVPLSKEDAMKEKISIAEKKRKDYEQWKADKLNSKKSKLDQV